MELVMKAMEARAAMKGGAMTQTAVLASVAETNGFEDNTGERHRRGVYGGGL